MREHDFGIEEKWTIGDDQGLDYLGSEFTGP